jgi:hypothetical protein
MSTSKISELEQGSMLLPRGPAMDGIVESQESVDLANKLIKSTLSSVKLKITEKKIQKKKPDKRKPDKIPKRNIVKNSFSKNALSKRNKNIEPLSKPDESDKSYEEVLNQIKDDEEVKEVKKKVWQPKISGYSTIKRKVTHDSGREVGGRVSRESSVSSVNRDMRSEESNFNRNNEYGKNYNPSLRKDDYSQKKGFSKLSGMNKNSIGVFSQKFGADGPDLLTVLKWHEERLTKFNDFKNDIIQSMHDMQYQIDNLNKKIMYVNVQDHNKFNNAANIIKRTWRLNRLRKSISIIKIQRCFRYWTNVQKMTSEINSVMQKLNDMKKQMGLCDNYLNSLDSKHVLPLEKLKAIHKKIKFNSI